jgi:hypothetical protein
MVPTMHMMTTIAQKKGNQVIARHDQYGRCRIQYAGEGVSDPNAFFILASRRNLCLKVMEALVDEIEQLTCMDHRMSSLGIPNIVTESSEFSSISQQTVDSIRHHLLGSTFFQEGHYFLSQTHRLSTECTVQPINLN